MLATEGILVRNHGNEDQIVSRTSGPSWYKQPVIAEIRQKIASWQLRTHMFTSFFFNTPSVYLRRSSEVDLRRFVDWWGPIKVTYTLAIADVIHADITAPNPCAEFLLEIDSLVTDKWTIEVPHIHMKSATHCIKTSLCDRMAIWSWIEKTAKVWLAIRYTILRKMMNFYVLVCARKKHCIVQLLQFLVGTRLGKLVHPVEWRPNTTHSRENQATRTYIESNRAYFRHHFLELTWRLFWTA